MRDISARAAGREFIPACSRLPWRSTFHLSTTSLSFFAFLFSSLAENRCRAPFSVFLFAPSYRFTSRSLLAARTSRAALRNDAFSCVFSLPVGGVEAAGGGGGWTALPLAGRHRLSGRSSDCHETLDGRACSCRQMKNHEGRSRFFFFLPASVCKVLTRRSLANIASAVKGGCTD